MRVLRQCSKRSVSRTWGSVVTMTDTVKTAPTTPQMAVAARVAKSIQNAHRSNTPKVTITYCR